MTNPCVCDTLWIGVNMANIYSEIDKLQEQINAFRPLPKETLKQLREYYKIGITYTSNALEGNSLTEAETKIIIEDGLTVAGKPIRDCYEALGHAEAYDLMYKLAKEKSFSEANIKELHKLFYKRIDDKNAGNYRKVKVFISGSKYTFPPPEKVPSLMKEFIKSASTLEKKCHAIEYSALAHKEFVFIHPFIDGNGRIARLLMNLILLQKGFVSAVIPPVLRREYIQTLEKAHTSDLDFIEFIAQRVKETQKDYLRLLKS